MCLKNNRKWSPRTDDNKSSRPFDILSSALSFPRLICIEWTVHQRSMTEIKSLHSWTPDSLAREREIHLWLNSLLSSTEIYGIPRSCIWSQQRNETDPLTNATTVAGQWNEWPRTSKGDLGPHQMQPDRGGWQRTARKINVCQEFFSPPPAPSTAKEWGFLKETSSLMRNKRRWSIYNNNYNK